MGRRARPIDRSFPAGLRLAICALPFVFACQGRAGTGDELSVVSGSPDGGALPRDAATPTDGDDLVCLEDADCTLIDDCCTCAASSGEEAPVCEASCEQTVCEQWGIGQEQLFCARPSAERSYCSLGAGAACLPIHQVGYEQGCGEPPRCEPGTVPEGASGSCWSGRCVPASLCRGVSGCQDCDADQLCEVRVRTGSSVQLEENGVEFDRVDFQCVPRDPNCLETSCECADGFCGNGSCVRGPLRQGPYDTGVGRLNELSEGGVVCYEYDG